MRSNQTVEASGARPANKSARPSKADSEQLSKAKARVASRSPKRLELPEREACIRTAAYYLAEHRGFAQNHELDDWLAAEAEVDERLA